MMKIPRRSKGEEFAGSARALSGDHSFPEHDQIIVRLKQLYQGVTEQPVPKRFEDLLEALEARTAARNKSGFKS
jgi:hypothetical protein